ncbi:MAG: sulfite exporter TauE/SafE family protein [Candidatus Zambryskibacteria bacterium]|nr:sulfite exporter TauE/SafE family protein [Candidatus Zambryskibacteria bacterium]
MQKKITHTFHVEGMHCKSCSLVIEQELSDLSYIESVYTDFNKHTITVTGDFEGVPQEELAKDFSVLLASNGYTFSVEKPLDGLGARKWSDFKIAIPIALGVVLLFVLLQKMGLINLINTKNMTYSTAFIIGVIASLSSCAAVVGGLLLSMSATFAKEGDKIKPQLLFHGGRIISFFILGGVIGTIGSAFTLSTLASFILGLTIGIVMLILGINLLDVFHFTKKFQPAMPKFLSKHALGVSKWNHTLTPFLVGIITFFLPCGFTQSMQIYTLSAGGFFAGGLTMFAFALGTLPVLALISFSSFSIKNNSKSGIFFKSAGLIVIMFALFNLINSLVIIGFIPLIFDF